MGAVFLISMDALRNDKTQSMIKSLIFEAVIATCSIPFALVLGWGGRKEHVKSRRIRQDENSSVITGES